jgi:NNP family nitrate/nitrite transporter-like MFS transporter
LIFEGRKCLINFNWFSRYFHVSDIKTGKRIVMSNKTCPTPEPFNSVIGKIIFLTFLFFLSFISRFIFAPLLPYISNDLRITTAQAGSIFLFGAIGVAAGAICSGFISSKINHKGTLVLSILCAGVVLLGGVFVKSLLGIQMTMTLLGISAGFNLPSNVAVITAIVNRQDWGKALSVQQAAPPLSLILGPLLSVFFLTWVTWRIILAGIASILIVSTIALIRFGRFGNFPGDKPNFINIKEVCSCRSFWIMIALFAIGIGGHVGIYTMLPLYLVNEHGLKPELVNTMVGLSQISAFFMTFLGGWLTDKLGEKRTMGLILIISGVLNILMGISSGGWLKVIVFMEPAIVVCFFPSAFSALSRIVQPRFRSLVTSWTTPIAFIIGGGLFPAALGYMGQAFSIGKGISIAGIIMVLGASLVIFLDLLNKIEEGC